MKPGRRLDNMTQDRALKIVQGLLHDLRNGMRPYINPQEAEAVLKHIDKIREEAKQISPAK